MKYRLHVTMRSGRTYVTADQEPTAGQLQHVKQRAARNEAGVVRTFAAELHEGLGTAIKADTFITLGSCTDHVGQVGVNGRDIEAIAVEVIE